MHGGGAGGAGILDARRRFEAQVGRGLQHQRSGKILRREAGIEVAEHNLVDVARSPVFAEFTSFFLGFKLAATPTGVTRLAGFAFAFDPPYRLDSYAPTLR